MQPKHLLNNKNEVQNILVLDGELNVTKEFLQSMKRVFVTDGAANKILPMGITPDYIIGDMDSIDDGLIQKYDIPAKKLIHIKSQDTNDFQKALDFINNQGIRKLVVANFSGGELEHTLNNWSVLAKYSKALDIFVINGNRMGLTVTENLAFDARVGEKISIIPLGAACITTKGLRWELDEKYLVLGAREGASNVAETEKVSITIHNGQIFLFKESIF